MKYFFIGLSIILFSSCKKIIRIEFDGSTPGVKSGTFIIKNQRDSTIIGQNIANEKFNISGVLPVDGYYTMDIVDDADKSSHDRHFEVYLEEGKYSIVTESGKLFKYPKITSASKIQNELSAYYTLVDQQGADLTSETNKLNAKFDSVRKTRHAIEAFNSVVNKISGVQEKQNAISFEALQLFAKQYPQSSISAHLMSHMDYDAKPADYYAVFNTFSKDAQNSDEGKEIGTKLSHLIKLVPGATGPEIVGNTIDGKPFDRSTIKKKVILLDFWRASDPMSRTDHQQMLNMLETDMKGRDDFGIVSIDFDSKSDWWTTAVKADKMNWTQVSDLKGDDSPNAVNWAIAKIPTYFLVDGNWKIIERDLQLSEVPLVAARHLK